MAMDPFEVLGLQWGQCTEIDVIKTYRKLALENHPDKAGPEGEERMKSINNARDTILAKKLCSLPPPDEKPPESERQRRKKGPHSDPKPSKTKKPQPSQQQLEEQFWSRMPFLVGKIWGFVLETQPVRNESTHMPWHSMRSLYNSITSKLTAPDGSVDLERICSLIGSLFFAIKQLKIWNSNTFQEYRDGRMAVGLHAIHRETVEEGGKLVIAREDLGDTEVGSICLESETEYQGGERR